MMEYPSLAERPRPLREAAGTVARWTGVAGAFVISLAGFGVVTATQGDAITGLLGLIPGVVGGITSVWSAFRVAGKAEPLVTPVEDPRNNVGVRLVPATSRGVG